MKNLYQTLEVCELLATDTRVSILNLLAKEGPMRFTSISLKVGISSALLGHHLRPLVEKGLLTSLRQGRSTTYFINQSKIDDFLASLTAILKGGS